MNASPETLAPPAVVKTCRCGQAYTMKQWNSLEYVGKQDYDEDNDGKLELRNCSCGSTIAIIKE